MSNRIGRRWTFWKLQNGDNNYQNPQAKVTESHPIPDVELEFQIPSSGNSRKSIFVCKFISLHSGIYKPYMKCFDLNDLALKFERGIDAEIIKLLVLSDDYSKAWKKADILESKFHIQVVMLEDDRYLEFHAAFGRYFRMRIPRFGRDMAFCKEASDLFIVGNRLDFLLFSLISLTLKLVAKIETICKSYYDSFICFYLFKQFQNNHSNFILIGSLRVNESFNSTIRYFLSFRDPQCNKIFYSKDSNFSRVLPFIWKYKNSLIIIFNIFSSEIYRLNLEQGEWLPPLQTAAPAINCAQFSSEHQLFLCGEIAI